MRLTAEIRNSSRPGMPYWDNANQWAKFVYKFRANSVLALKAIERGITPVELLASRFPFLFADWPKPPSMHIELTDACNLTCVYCNNPYFPYPRKVMTRATLQALLRSLDGVTIGRICVGGGEPTLHPRFAEFASAIRTLCKILTIVTNGQWTKRETAEVMLRTPFDLIEVSVDAGGKSGYERSRVGASFERLQNNLTSLLQLRKALQSRALINIRLMMRPSQKLREAYEKKCWKSYCDSMMPQYVLQPNDVPAQEDVYISKYAEPGAYPRCTLPFRNLQVRANGDVPLCQVSGSKLDSQGKLMLGNVNRDSILELWNSSTLRQYRSAHRSGDARAMPACEGCAGC